MKRFDKGYIYSGLLTDFFYSIAAAFVFFEDLFLNEDSNPEDIVAAIPVFAIGFAVIYLCFVTYRILYYRTSGYELTDKEIKCNRGVLFRKRSLLDYERVHAVNKKQNLIHRIFGIAVLTVDSGSANTSHRAEITIIEKNAVVDALLEKLHLLKDAGAEGGGSEKQAEEVLLTDRDSLYRFTSAKKMLYTLINIASTAFFTAVLAFLGIAAIGACKALLRPDALGTWGQFFLYAVFVALGAMLLLSSLSFVGSILYSFIGYYNFTVIKRDGSIQISYGLLEKHTNTFGCDRIKAVKISQGLVQRILGFASIKLEVIGYTVDSGSDNKNATLGVLVPFCKYDEIGDILGRTLPDFVPSEKQTKAVSLFPFVSWFLLILGIVTGIALMGTLAVMAVLGSSAATISAVALAIFGPALAVGLLRLVGAILAYRTEGLAIANEKITVYSGGFLKSITVFMAKSLIAVEKVATPLRQKHGIASFVIHLKTNEQSNEVKLRIQRDTLADELEGMLKM